MICLAVLAIAECMRRSGSSAYGRRFGALAHQLQISFSEEKGQTDLAHTTLPGMTETIEKVLTVGRNCDSKVHSDAVGILVDGEDYFSAARDAMKKARDRIVLVAWEFHSQTQFVHGDPDDGLPTEVGPFLNSLLAQNETLEVYILVWDYMCIDDSLVFCGGMDISISRWDSHEHLVEDSRRVNPDGKSYDPYHDVHTVVVGEAADALCKLAYGRWENATGETLPSIEGHNFEDLWPEKVPKVFQDVEIGLSIIYASPTEDPSQMDQLHLDLFDAAQDFIFIENQYFSSNVLAKGLQKQLRKKDGPEVIMLLPKTTSGWMVESTVGRYSMIGPG